jgi:hypothetical protein
MAGLESATTINQLNPLNPSDTLDYVSTGDDHLRLIKSTLQNTFPRITGPVTASDADLSNTTYLVDTGTANAVVLTFSPVWTSYVAGRGFTFRAAVTNTGAVTVNVNSLGAIALVGQTGQALVGGEIVANMVYRATYNGTSFVMTANDGYSRVSNQVIAATTNASMRNTGTGSLTLGTNAQNNVVLNADGTTSLGGSISGNATITGNLTVNGVVTVGGNAIPFPSGTRLMFPQAAAPTGWTQITDDTADNRMLRVVNTTGGGTAGTHSPILNNVVPSHTHTITTGTESADHTHNDAGHTHTWTFKTTTGGTLAGGDANSVGNTTVNTGVGYAALGGRTAGHTHSGTTNNGSSQTNWVPRSIDMIMCSRN